MHELNDCEGLPVQFACAQWFDIWAGAWKRPMYSFLRLVGGDWFLHFGFFRFGFPKDSLPEAGNNCCCKEGYPINQVTFSQAFRFDQQSENPFETVLGPIGCTGKFTCHKAKADSNAEPPHVGEFQSQHIDQNILFGRAKTDKNDIGSGRGNFVCNRIQCFHCLLYTSPSPRDKRQSRMPSSA